MSEELKPCPHCGEEHICLFDEHDDEGLSFAVGCVTGDCPGHVATSWHYDTREDAIEAWNRRAERTCTLKEDFAEPMTLKRVMEYECSECGGLTNAQILDESDLPRYCANCGAKVIWR